MAEEKEQELNEAELSDVKNSIAALAKKYITGSFFDKLADSSGIKIAKDILLDDLKNMIGHGTSGLAAKKFANAIQMAKNPVAVDTILANYMLKGDGMGSGIGYSEAEEIKPFKKFLSESREEKKEVSQDNIDEARKNVEARGYRVIEEKKIDEAEVKARLFIPVYDYDIDEVVDLIENSLKNTESPTFLRNKFGEIKKGKDEVIIGLNDDDHDIVEDLRDIISDYIYASVGLEAEYDEDLLDYYPVLLKKSHISK